MSNSHSMVAVDVGNSRIKLGRFDSRTGATGSGLPEPAETLALVPEGPEAGFDVAPLADWLAENVAPGTPLLAGSVNRASLEVLQDFLREYDEGPWNHLRQLPGAELPIVNRTEHPERVGIDRLAAAVAVNAVRRETAPAIVVDFGTAITVDLVASDSGFEGGAILPGVAMAAEALHTRTDALPNVKPVLEGKSPPAVGRSTTAAIAAGLYWGTVGAVREVIARQCDGLTTAPQVFVTGGTSPDMARLLGSPDYTVRYLPHLVLAGIAIAAEALGSQIA